MSKYYCYLCASDEGMLLDTFGDDGKIFRENIETCLSVKIKRSDVLSSKICHKCVYELDSCSKFLHKCEHSRDLKEGRARSKRGCVLCGENGTKARILEIKKEESLKVLLQKISKVCPGTTFNDRLASLSICLDCRYNLDVLYDLRTIYNKTLNKLKKIEDEDLALSDLPKLGLTKTSVVSRKTTDNSLPGQRLAVDYNSDSSTTTSTMSTASTKRKRGRPRKVSNEISPLQYRCCDECKTCVEHGIDMYRYHRTGLTVCRDCWLTMDPEKVKNGKRRRLVKADNEGNTKLCAVFVKDVLSNASPNERAYKIEKDKYGNTTYLITDESEESEEKEKTPPKRLRKRAESVTSVETTTSTMETKKSTKRAATMKKNEKDDVPIKKVKASTTRTSETEKTSVKTRTRNGVAEDTNVPMTMRTRRGAVESAEVVKVEAKVTSVDGGKKIGIKKIARPSKPPSSKTTSKETKTSSADSSSTEIKVARQTRARKAVKSTSDVPKMETVERPSMRRTRSNSCTSQQDIVPPSVRYKGPPEESLPESRTPETKPKSSRAKTSATKIAKSDSELEKPYTCSVCQITCKNKLIGKAHELTHEKQPEVKLERVVVPEIIIEEAPAEVSSVEDHEEQSHDISSTSDQKNENSDGISSAIKNPMKQETYANEEDPIEDEKSPVKKDSMADEKNDELENDVDEKEADAIEITTEKLIVKDTEISKENTSNESNEHMENNENENKENDENENKHGDDNEDKDNDENENKENDDIEIKEKDDSEANENIDNAIEKKDEAEHKEKDAVEKRQNYDSDNKNDSDTEIIEDDERTESSRVTESREETKDETVQQIEESEKPDSTPNEEIEGQTDPEEPEESPEESTETAVNAEDIPETGETETVENKTVAQSDKILYNNVVDNSDEVVETSADSSTTIAAEPSDKIEENTDVDNEEKQITESEKTVDSTGENDNKEEEEEEDEVTEAEKSIGSTSKNVDEEEKQEEAEAEKNEKSEEDVDCGRRKDDEDETVTESEKTIDSTKENDDEEELVEEEVIMNDKPIDSTNENDDEKTVAESEKSIDSTQENGNEEKNVAESEETIDATEKNEDEVESPEVTRNDARFLESSNVNETETRESANVVNSMIHEVFDLASAEVKKRLEKENPNDNHKSTTPVDETLENISLEVNKTSDMLSSNNDDESIEKLS